MNRDAARKICLSFPGATEQVQWGNDLVFKVGGKMFAVTALEASPHWIGFKASPGDFAALIETPGFTPAPYLARAQWVSVEWDHPVPAAELRRLLRQAYDLVVAKLPKRVQEGLK